MSELVWVYKYKHWDAERQQFEISRSYYTLEAIRAGLGVVAPETGMKVTDREIVDGKYIGGHVAARFD